MTKKSPAQLLSLPISERKVLIALGDIAAINVAVLISLRIWAIVGRIDFTVGFVLSQLIWFIVLTALWLLLAATNNFYDLALTARWARAQARLLIITFQLLVIYVLIFFLSDRSSLPRLFIVYYAVSSYVLIALWRLARPFLMGWRPFRQRELILGTGWASQTIVEAIREFAPADYEVVGLVADGIETLPAKQEIGVSVVGRADQLANLVRDLRIHEVILASGSGMSGAVFQSLMTCYEAGIPLRPMHQLYEQLTGRVPVEHISDQWNVILPMEGRSPLDPYTALKRLIDIVFSLIGLVMFAAFVPLLALIMFLDSRGPIFYQQERVGKSGRTFNVIKLRSMIRDAEATGGPIWAVSGDSRITRVGWFLRKTRLDEVPQLWNILRGEMSLIGPRPERPYFVERLQRAIPFYRARLAVAPGLTGWAQVNYGYGSTDHDALVKLQYDLYYIRHRSLVLDTVIVLRTVGRVIRLQGT